MSQFNNFYQLISNTPLNHWLKTLPEQLNKWEKNFNKNKLNQWFNTIEKIPILTPTRLDLLHGVKADCNPPLSTNQKIWIESLLRKLMPWRKGPFSLYGINIDTEWQSDWKWKRVTPHIKPLIGRLILDVGCGSGYYLWRMIGAHASLVIGIDPMKLFYCQFESIYKLLGNNQRVYFLPLNIEQLPALNAFDTVFSMGVLYHCRFPLNHLLQLKNQLISGGELVLETLLIKDDNLKLLVPFKRYAQMKNVYYIPSATVLIDWLKKSGFINIRQVDISTTSIDEQRRTTWMTSKSLSDFLNPEDPNLTVENYPAPLRSVFLAEKP
ncbi:tRNA (mo5U34)-methyltransferase [Candidatus Gullanella endobia]|uniref:tRNA U34 carboxymethyltransferase n=1 Tax=Candidatus Gullanella endobia TaxID=1070130 RepID=A0A143WQV9_9ENTR|nr:tRNA 5-methoxyuridine(34)/uridine 5-oxyacetic acid(34) synthase CmoB [Candidatus Gullanella endobia]CUX96001.1 tRNA (mo5U34)-methyltransferase [Candidatus Gullanella endobia]